MIKELIKKFKMYGLKKFLTFGFIEAYRFVFCRLLIQSYSQQGEDIVIDRLLKRKKNGLYVDIGANDPIRFSNTYRFYKRGWNGINLEPNPVLYEKLSKIRKRDINLNLGIALKTGELIFYKFFPDTLSTFSKEQSKEYIKKGFELIEERKIEVQPLSKILKEHCDGKEIDFLTVDTESFDLIVLQSNDWKKYKPKVVCIECSENGEEKKFLENLGYKMVFDNGLNNIFRNLCTTIE